MFVFSRVIKLWLAPTLKLDRHEHESPRSDYDIAHYRRFSDVFKASIHRKVCAVQARVPKHEINVIRCWPQALEHSA